MHRMEEAKRWFSEAEWDLESTGILHESRRYNSCAFLCQQAAEKSVKPSLFSVGESPFGHSVLQLLQRFAEASSNDISELRPLAAELGRHYPLGTLAPCPPGAAFYLCTLGAVGLRFFARTALEAIHLFSRMCRSIVIIHTANKEHLRTRYAICPSTGCR
jgi:HEPN domain-containing protein